MSHGVKSILLIAAVAALTSCGKTTSRVPPIDIRGDLGGRLVSLPSSQVRFVEFDPGSTTRIMSFGYQLSMPSGRPGSTAASASRGEYTVRVGVLSNSAYGSTGDDFLERMSTFDDSIPRVQPPNRLVVPGASQYGLAHFVSVSSGAIALPRPSNHEYYVHRNASGRVDVYIDCYTGSATSPCSAHFFASRLRAHLEATFPRTSLADWNEVRSATDSAISGFILK